MKRWLTVFSIITLFGSYLAIQEGCKKDSGPTGPSIVATYPVTAIVNNPQGQPQGGALLSLKNAPFSDPKFSTYTDSTGKGTIQAPAGAQTLVAQIGSAFLAEINMIVAASDSGTNAGSITLHQNTAVKVLVVQASAEQLEDVLRVVGYTTFDSTTVYALRDSAASDSNATLNYLKQYTLVFSDCDGGTEESYPALSRVYGRYVQQGGKIYGGHYNYYNLRVIWSPYFDSTDYRRPGTDSIQITEQSLQRFLGFSVAQWNSTDSRYLSGYEKFDDIPATSRIYGVISGLQPPVAVIVENYIGTGKYLWTDYHNQDIKTDPVLIKIVQYFLLNL